MNFDILKIKHDIEERRLILGQKIEKFLLKKLEYGKNLLRDGLNNKKTALYGSIFIILLSVFLQSGRDVGEVTASSLDRAFIFREIADYFKINVIIFAQILINFCGAVAIYFSYRILVKSELARNAVIFNLLILSFTAGFFLRNYDFYANEIFTESAIFLIIFYPIFAIFLSGRALGAIGIVVIFSLLIFLLQINSYFSEIKLNIYPILLFLFLLRKETGQSELLKKLFFTTILASILSCVTGNFVILQAIFLPQIFLTFYFIIPKINFKKDWVFIIPILLIFHFNSADVIALALNLCVFWWVFVLVDCFISLPFQSSNYHNDNIFLPCHPREGGDPSQRVAKKIFLRDKCGWVHACVNACAGMTVGVKCVLFLALIFLAIYLALLPNFSEISWLISALIFATILDHKRFSTLFYSAIFAILSYTIYINFHGIYDYNNSHNHINHSIIAHSKIYAKNDEITIITNEENITHQVLIYMNKTHSLIFNKNQNIAILKSQLQDPQNKLIFIFNDPKPCKINILEEYPEIFKNYKFLNSIISTKNITKEFIFFSEDEISKNLVKPTNTIVYNVEVYSKN